MPKLLTHYITNSKFLDELRDVSAGVVRGCNRICSYITLYLRNGTRQHQSY